MKVSKVYKANAESLFDFLKASFKNDYERNTNKLLRSGDLKPGLKFTKTFGAKNQNSVLVEVEHMTAPHHYSILLKSSRGSNVIEYLIEAVTDGEIEVTYREEYINTGFFTKLNNLILGPLFRKKLEGRMLAQLDQLIAYSNNERTNYVKPNIP